MLRVISKTCLFIAVITLAAAVYIDLSREEGITISEDEAQTMIDKRLQEKPLVVSKLGVHITVREAKVDFLESPAAKTKVDALYRANGYGLSGDGFIQFEARLHYDSGDVFLRELQVIDHKFQFDNPEKVQRLKGVAQGALKKFGTLVSDAANKLDPERREALKDLHTRSIDEFKKKAVNKAVDMLQSKPVYSLNGKDMKRTLMVKAVESLRTDEHAAHIKLHLESTVQAATLYIISCVLSLFAGVGLVLSRRH